MGRPVRALRGVLARAEVQTDVLQVVKVVLAAVLAWVLAAYWLDLTHAFLAPWAAMLTVHGTVSRTFRSAAQTGAATLVGVIVAWAVTESLGYDAFALALALLVGMCVSRLPVLREEGVTAATTALFVITTGAGGDGVMLAQRLGDTLLGVGVGVAVNLLVLPPLDDHLADRQLDDVRSRLSGLLTQMAEDLSAPVRQEHADDWIARTRSLDRSLARATDLLSWTSEAQAWNPRRRRSPRASDTALTARRLEAFESAVPHARAIARTVGESVVHADAWDPRFRDPWLRLLADTAARVDDPDADIAELRGRASELARELSVDDLPALLWPTYGALLASLRLLLEGLDDPQPV